MPHDAAGCSVPPLLLVGGIAFFAWRAMLWRAARLEASAEGLRLCGLWRGPLRPWRRILRLDVTPDGGAFIVEEGGGDLPVPAVLANLDVLPGLHAALKR